MKFLAASVLVLGLTVSSSLGATTTTPSNIIRNCPSYGRWFSKYCGSTTPPTKYGAGVPSCSREPNKEEKFQFCVDFVTHQNCGRDPYAQWLINAKYGCRQSSLPCCLGWCSMLRGTVFLCRRIFDVRHVILYGFHVCL